jgi:acetoin utilization protein AcuB
MPHPPTLKTLMPPFPYVVDVEASLAQAQDMMSKHVIRHLPVTEGGTIGWVGVLTDRDLHRSHHGLRSNRAQADSRVRDVYVSEAYVVEFTERLDVVLLQMAMRHIGSALVVRQGKLVGIFTAMDACQDFGDYLRAQLPPDPDNESA